MTDASTPQGSSALKSLNVFMKPLLPHSTGPPTSPLPTGFLRNGYCEVPPSDTGNHSIAAVVTDSFLDFSASRGNDLRSIGLKEGCKWCLCVSRWREAFDARKSDNDDVVPRVWLNMTNKEALGKVRLEELRGFAVDKEQ